MISWPEVCCSSLCFSPHKYSKQPVELKQQQQQQQLTGNKNAESGQTTDPYFKIERILQPLSVRQTGAVMPIC